MIPISLQLKNFMSYGTSNKVLDFTRVDLACLTGRNGAGKTTLLEAVTWALWGKGRAKSDDDLVKSGQTDMSVDFQFLLEGNIYRVVRSRSKSGRGHSSLEFMVYDGNKKEIKISDWTLITGGTKAETQDNILKVLKMSYETFVNSAFLRQGRADEFTMKKPTERKQVLAEILGLSYYDQLAEKTKELNKELNIKEESLKKQLEFIQSEIENNSELDKKAKEIKGELDALNAEIEKLDQGLEKLQEEKKELEQDVEKVKHLDEKIEVFQKDIDEADHEISEHQKNIDNDEKILEVEEQINQSYQAILDLREKEQKYSEILSQRMNLINQKGDIEKKITEKKIAMQSEQGKLSERIEQSKKNIEQKSDLQKRLDLFKKELELIKSVEKDKDDTDQIMIKLRDGLSHNKTLLKQIEIQGKELKVDIENIEATAGSNCPLCKQIMTESHKSAVIADLTAKKNNKAKLYSEVRIEVEKFEDKIRIGEEKLKYLAKDISKKNQYESELNIIQQGLEKIETYQSEFEKLEKQYNEVIKKIESGDFDENNSKKVEAINKQLAELSYDEKEHQAIKKELLELKEFEEMKKKLDSAKQKSDQERNFIEKLIHSKQQKSLDLEKFKKQRKTIRLDVRLVDEIAKDIVEKNEARKILRTQVNEIQTNYGAIHEKVQRLDKLKKDVKNAKKDAQETTLEKSILDELIIAFGKKGIQAMIIEAVIPEIEEEANKILGDITDNRMQVRFSMQKEKKTDKQMADTLDILIEDEAGVKDYEMYSGGEAYRINFAIRIALSKLLAHRAGAKLQFLVIDEGFGTQDDAGKEHLIQVINAISKDFNKIIVISHIQELKDAFQSRIEITKDEKGSRYEIIG